jgi:large subunit ribosomal protein L17
MLANMASSLILHKRITTTTAKAKALRTYIEPLITKAKHDNTHSRRTVFSYLKDKEAVSELFRDVAERVGERPGGYTRILKTGTRLGDNAEMCFIELVDYNETYTGSEGKPTGSSKRRRRRGGKKKSQKTAAETAQESTREAEQQQEEDTSAEPTQEETKAASTQQRKEEEKPEDQKGKDTSSDEEKKEE